MSARPRSLAPAVRLATILGAFALAASGAAPSALAGWSPVRRIHAGQQSISPPALAVNARGDAVLAWARKNTIYATVARAGGQFGGVEVVARGNAGGDVLAAIDGGGAAVVVWRYGDRTRPPVYDGSRPLGEIPGCCEGLRAARRAPGGRWGRAQTISLPGESVGFEAVAAGAVGSGLGVAWDAGGTIQAAFCDARGRFGPPVQISRYLPGNRLSLAFDRMGAAHASWVTDSDGDLRVLGSVRTLRGGIIGPRSLVPAPIGGPGFAFWSLVTGTALTGEATFLWARDDGAPGSERAMVTARSGSAGLQTLDRVEGLGAILANPAVAVAPSGRAAAAWIRQLPQGTSGREIRLALRAGPTRSFIAVRTVGRGDYPAVAIGDLGYGAVVWRYGPGVRAVILRPGSVVSSPRTLDAGSGSPAVAVDSSGRVTVAWCTDKGVFVARYRPSSTRH